MAVNSWLSREEAGEIIKRAREAIPLTQDQVAEKLNVDKSYISKLEGGLHHAGRSKYFPQLVEVLKIEPDDVRRLNPGAVVAGPMIDPPLGDAERHQAKPPRQLPDGLIEAIQKYGSVAPDLQQGQWQQFLAGFRPRNMDEKDADDWYDFYRNLVKFDIKPEDDN
ncbi:hypothetical protein Dxin01_04047 [Deinococcus xinjiangensis]|uniref:HTH cro/C1-type domain-containing protein n=2 Tax=Deinococcus xinjiangensis TaxID=457454 RepID=A0ABP9VLM9_9DEIO